MPRIVLAILALGLAGCAAPQKAMLDDFPNHATRGPVYVYWTCSRPEPGLLQVDGVAVQPGYPSPVLGLKMRLEGLDARGATLSVGEATAKEYAMQTMQQNPFQVTVRTVGTEKRFNLTYKYWLHMSGGGMEADGEPEDHEYVAQRACPAEKL
jgi:hypothetical protein